MKRAYRKLVRERAGNRCEYCGMPQELVPLARFHVEHVIPKQHRGALLIGLTRTGRATIAVLDMNHRERVRLRRELMVQGVFPPAD